MAYAGKSDKRKESDLSFQNFKKELAAGTIGSLYVFCGEETYLRDYYLGKLKEALLTGGLDDFNYHIVTAREYSLSLLREYVDAMPMLSERTLVVVNDVDLFKGDREGLGELLSDLPDYVCLIFVYDVLEYKPDGRSKLGALLKDKARVVNFVAQGQDDLVKWIARRFRALDHDIAIPDAQYLIFLCGDLMNGLIPEIGKIGAYAREKRVTRADIDAVAIPRLDAIVFQLTDALGAGNFDRAFAVMADLLHQQEHPIMILAAIGRQLRQLYTARLAYESGKGTRWLMELWGLKHDFQAEKLMTSARRFSLPWCRRAVKRCEELDLAMKSTGADGQELLTGFLLELAGWRAA